MIPLGVLDAERDERFSRHVGGELVGSEIEDGPPELEDGADQSDPHQSKVWVDVPVLVQLPTLE